ncbi:MAG: class I SAM-dependent methyltransferase [Chitinophagaceae bacterium]
MINKTWYKEWFNSPYYDLLYNYRNEKEAKKFIEKLIEYLQAKQGCRILDAACGKGRYSKVLANMGFDVTGIDLAPSSITFAQKFEQKNLHFYLHDMRLPFWINYFDFAFNFFTSFGYFATKREHDNTIRMIAQSLKPKGIFVMDYLNVHCAEDNLIKNEQKVIEGILFRITRWQNETHFFKQIEVEDKLNLIKQSHTEKVAKFSFGDFVEMLSYQHLQVQDVFGNYELENYDIKKSPRMIIVSKKIER